MLRIPQKTRSPCKLQYEHIVACRQQSTQESPIEVKNPRHAVYVFPGVVLERGCFGLDAATLLRIPQFRVGHPPHPPENIKSSS